MFCAGNDILNLVYLTYVIKALLTDLQSEAFTRIIFAPEIEQQPDFLSSAFIPSSCTDIHGNTYNFNASYEFAHEVDLAKTIVISKPCEEKKIRDSVKAITQRGFVYQSNNHEMTYYADLDFAVVTNGYHSQCIGALKREGTVIAHMVFDTEKCYLNLAVLKHKQDDNVIFAPQKELKELRKMITKSEKYAKKLFLKSGFKYEKVEGMAHFMPEIQSIWDKIHLKKDNRQC